MAVNWLNVREWLVAVFEFAAETAIVDEVVSLTSSLTISNVPLASASATAEQDHVPAAMFVTVLPDRVTLAVLTMVVFSARRVQDEPVRLSPDEVPLVCWSL